MKTALITGTSQGLGKDIAQYFLQNNFKVIGLSRTVGNIEHKNFIHIPIDLSCHDQLAKLFNNFPYQVDLVIHNAARFKQSTLENLSIEEICNILNVNIKSPVILTKLLLPYISKNSHIIFINSVAGLYNLDNQSVYCASKHALTSFAKIIGKELRKDKIKVFSIHPGGINTPLWNESNPYPLGDHNKALSKTEIVKIIDLILNLNDNTYVSNIEVFPTIEWHG